MASLVTTVGLLNEDEVGLILPHEHVFVDFRLPDHPEHGQADPGEVVRLMAPQLTAARAAGVTVQVDCTPVGLARRADVLKAVSEASGMPLVVATGVYREPHIPAWVHAAGEAELVDWMLRELQEGIEDSGIRAGWIKLSAGDDGLTECEEKVLRAAAVAASATGAVIGSHTIRGRVVMSQLDVIREVGLAPDRFIWIHAHMEQNRGLHAEAARRGAWLEYDAIGDTEDAYYVGLIVDSLKAGFGRRLLISQDRGWYDPALTGGGTPRPFTYLPDQFLPRMRQAGIEDATIRQLTESNPFRAFAR